MKKKQIKTGVEILISILGLLALYWIDLYAVSYTHLRAHET